VTLASGALLTLNANGTFDYDPNGAFEDLPDSASGAINLLRDDSFTYTLADGDTATVTITVAGLDSDGDILRGTKGIDTIFAGGIGSDLYLVDDAGDTIVETAGNGTADRVAAFVSFALAADDDIEILSTASAAGKAAINLTGNILSQTIVGNAGNNILHDGGVGGADTMVGLDGNDTYVVYNSGDVIVEFLNEGTDRVSSGVDYTLGKAVHVELLTTTSATATYAVNLTGNAFAQTIRGNAGDNVLHDGGTGAADTLSGGKGDDFYQIYNSGDTIVELDGEGADRVSAAVDFVLTAGASVEYLNTTSLLSAFSVDLTGNALVQLVRGNQGVNTLDGGGGEDVLYGMGGADNFRFSTALGGDNIARIADFAAGTDKVHLDDAIFTALTTLGALDANAFKDTAAGAKDADDRIIYNSDTGALAYDADGSGTAFANIRFATITGSPLLTAADFVVV
jgi:VCBS repeat-containing protein